MSMKTPMLPPSDDNSFAGMDTNHMIGRPGRIAQFGDPAPAPPRNQGITESQPMDPSEFRPEPVPSKPPCDSGPTGRFPR